MIQCMKYHTNILCFMKMFYFIFHFLNFVIFVNFRSQDENVGGAKLNFGPDKKKGLRRDPIKYDPSMY